MKDKKYWMSWFVTICCFFASLLLFFEADDQREKLERHIPGVVEVYRDSESGKGLGFAPWTEGQFKNIAVRSSGMEVEVGTDMGIPLSGIMAYAVSEAYGEALGLEWMEGGFWSGQEKMSGNAVVLPEKLFRLFVDSGYQRGQPVWIQGEEYVISGVYRERKGLWELGIADCFVVYVNWLDGELDAEQFLIPAEDNSPALRLVRQTAAEYGIELEGKVRDLNAQRCLGEDLPQIAAALSGAALVFGLLCFSGYQILRLYDSWRRENGVCLRHGVCGLISFALGMAGLFLMTKGVILPAAYIPEDNLFDFAHYWSLFVDSAQYSNGANMTVDLGKIASIYLLAEGGMLLAAVLMFWVGVVRTLWGIRFILFKKIY